MRPGRLKLHQQAGGSGDGTVWAHRARLPPYRYVPIDLSNVDILAGTKNAATPTVDAAGRGKMSASVLSWDSS